MNHDVLGVVAARSEALATQAWDVIEGQLHPDFVYTNSRGQRLTRGEYVDFLRNGALRWTRQWLETSSVVTAGDTAVVTGVVVDDVMVGDEAHLLRFATTQTYVRMDGVWRYLAGHTAPLAAD